MGADSVSWGVSSNPPANLLADGSFMPTGGSVPYTWTIYANAFRVADKIVDAMGAHNLQASTQ